MKEALARVRHDLGGDAVIIRTREVWRPRFFGLASRKRVEVTVADAMPPESLLANRANADSAGCVTSSLPPTGVGAALTTRPRFRDELSGGRAVVATLSARGGFDDLRSKLPPALIPTYYELVESDVPEIVAHRLVEYVADSIEPGQFDRAEAVHATLQEAIEECIPVAPPIHAVAGTRRVVALVGPTGVGKTTTVAKLAANFKLASGLRVGFVTVDRYRIAAVEQLKTFAQVIDVPLAVVNDAEEMPQVLDRLSPIDLVFIDTAGQCPRGEERIRELAEFLLRARPDEVYLVLSAVDGERSLYAVREWSTSIQVDRLVLTKLDEAINFGGILALLELSARPVSYLTTGQAVPDGIEVADRKRLARLILRQEDLV